MPLKDTVAEFYYVVAWPIWAGGYPQPKEVSESLNSNIELIQGQFAKFLKYAGLEDLLISYLSIYPGNYQPIDGLLPENPQANSAALVVRLIAYPPIIQSISNIEEKCTLVATDFAGTLQAHCRNHAPGALAGANLYDVTGTWDPGPGLRRATLPAVGQKPSLTAKSQPDTATKVAFAQSGTVRDGVFVSYCHRDSKWLTRLQTHLEPLSRDLRIKIWDDTQIQAGSDWRSAIEEALRVTKVAILLVTADFMASEFITNSEIPTLIEAARAEGAIILPVIISPSMFGYHKQLGRIQAANSPDEYLLRLSRARQEEVLHGVALRLIEAFQADG